MSSLTEQSGTAFNLFLELKEHKEYLYADYCYFGSLLSKLKEKNLFKKAVGGMSWRDFLSQPEIGISEREAEFYIDLYNSVLNSVNFGATVPLNSLKFLVKKLKNEKYADKITEIVSAAQTLTLKDLKARYHEVKTNDAPKTYSYVVMKRCNETNTLTKEHNVKDSDIRSKLGDKLEQ